MTTTTKTTTSAVLNFTEVVRTGEEETALLGADHVVGAVERNPQKVVQDVEGL